MLNHGQMQCYWLLIVAVVSLGLVEWSGNSNVIIVEAFTTPVKSHVVKPPKASSFQQRAVTTNQEESNVPNRLQSIMSASYPRLNNWSLLESGNIVGVVSNHPSIEDGDVITTSPISQPEHAAKEAIVQTLSGTYYKLLNPSNKQLKQMEDGEQQEESLRSSIPLALSQLSGSLFSFTKPAQPPKEQRTQEWIDARMKYKLRLDTVGLQDEYLLAGKPVRSTSGKSKIWEGYRSDPSNNGLPTEDPPVCVKISTNIEAVSREYDNYCKLRKLGNSRGPFVECHDFFPVAGYTDRLRTNCALVIEKGALDLKAHLNERGRLEGEELKEACTIATQCLQSLHMAGLVWTDLKTENFVVMEDGEVKGIDLESAMPVGDNPVDYSPEACPPEFAAAFLSGEGPYFRLDFSYDVWSLGMLMFELATGRGAFDGKTPAQITKLLRDSQDPVAVNAYEFDEDLKKVVAKCLRRDPLGRPSIKEILRNPYFGGKGEPSGGGFFDFLFLKP